MGFETLILSAILPAGVELIKNVGGALGRKFLGLSVDDQLKLENATVDKMKALAQLDNPGGTPSQWVVDLRAAFRYVTATLVILIGTTIVFLGASDEIKDAGLQLIGMPFAFIFGERLLLSLKGGKR